MNSTCRIYLLIDLNYILNLDINLWSYYFAAFGNITVDSVLSILLPFLIYFNKFQAGILAVGRGNSVVEPTIGEDGTNFLLFSVVYLK